MVLKVLLSRFLILLMLWLAFINIIQGFLRNASLVRERCLIQHVWNVQFQNVFGVDARSVYGYNLGEHGNSQFTAWSQVRVKGQPISTFTDAKTLDEIAHEAMIGGHTVFYGKKYTSYGIASAAIRLALAIVSDSHEELPVSNYYEPLDTYLSYPAIVGREGIIEQIKLTLPAEEEAKTWKVCQLY